jgi:hypothetical protein
MRVHHLPRAARPAVAAVAAVILLIGVSAQAAPKSLAWADKGGDANGLNGEVLNDPDLDAGIATPGSQAGGDIVKTELANTYAKVKGKSVCTGMTATLTLSAPPMTNAMFRISGPTANAPSIFNFEHDTGGNSDQLRHASSATDDNNYSFSKPVRTIGNKIVFTLTLKDMKEIDEGPGTVMKGVHSSVAASIKGLLYLPVLDKSSPATASNFTFCG